jgi:cyanophycinase
MAVAERQSTKGRLFVVGGHEVHDGRGIVLAALSQLIGRGKLVVCTVASEEPAESWAEYDRTFRTHGVRHRFHLPVDSRQDAGNPRTCRILDDASCVFFTGGDQLRITSLLGDSPVYRKLIERFDAGAILAGTSAGASAFSDTMLVSGPGSASPRIHDDLALSPGLGFVRDMVIDQHFAERGRIGRLLAVVGQNPRVLGVGIDENTAIDLRPGRHFRVIGDGGVTVLDGRHVTYTSVRAAEAGRTMSLYDIRLHVLGQNDAFDLGDRRPEAHSSARIERVIERGRLTPVKVGAPVVRRRSRRRTRA